MATVERALPVVFEHEVGARWRTGGYTNDPDDPGGPTKYGVSFRYLKGELANVKDDLGHLAGDIDGDGDVDADDVRALTIEKATEIYHTRWWDRFNYGAIVDQQCATKVFDCAINMGVLRAHLILNKAVGDCGYHVAEDLPVGTNYVKAAPLGGLILDAINECESRELLLAYCDQMKSRYVVLATNNVSLQKYLNGWLERARWPFTKNAYVA